MRLENNDILFVSNQLADGGAARVVCELAGEFVRRGDKVGIAAYEESACGYELPSQVQVEYGPGQGGALTKAKRIAWLRRVVKRNPRACVIAFEYFVNMQTILACKGLKNRVIVSERNDPARVGSGKKTNGLRERLYRRADMLVCQTEDAAAYFSDAVTKCVIFNPVKNDLPEPYSGSRRKAVVTFCRLERQKNLEMLIEAFAAFSRSHEGYSLEIYGDGSQESALGDLVAARGLGDSVFVSHARTDVHQVVRDASLFVLPSNYEGLSNSMLEAMAIGLPVVCTDCPCGGARTVIRDGENGLLVPVGDTAALAAAMVRVADEPELAERLGAAAAGIREKLSVARIADQWSQVISR